MFHVLSRLPRQIRTEKAKLVGVILFGIGLRAHHLTTRSFWLDEAFCWRVAQSSFSEMIDQVSRDYHPPLFFLVLKLWEFFFGDSMLALRSLSILTSGVAIWAAYMITREIVCWQLSSPPDKSESMVPTEMPLFAAAVVACSVLQIRWAWEVRMYAFGTALCCLSGWSLFRALRQGRTVDWIAFMAFASGFLYTHNFAIIMVASQFVGASWLVSSRYFKKQRHGLLQVACRLIVSGLVIAIVYCPWLPTLLRQRAQVADEFWITPFSTASLFKTSYRLWISPEYWNNPGPETYLSIAITVAIFLGLLVRFRATDWYIAINAFLPVGLASLLALSGVQIFHARYLVFAHCYMLIGLAVVVGGFPRTLRTSCQVTIIGMMLFVQGFFKHVLDIQERPGMKAAAEYISTHCDSRDIVIVSSPFLFSPCIYYLRQTAEVRLLSQADIPYPPYFGMSIVSRDELITEDELAKLLVNRLWTIGMSGRDVGFSNIAIPEKWANETHRTFSEVYFPRGEIFVDLYLKR